MLEGVASLREPAPQLLIDGTRQTRTAALHVLPLGEELTQAGTRLLPLDLRRVLLCQGLGFHDESFTVLRSGQLRGLSASSLSGLSGLGIGDEGVERGAQTLEIADDVGFRQRLLQRLRR